MFNSKYRFTRLSELLYDTFTDLGNQKTVVVQQNRYVSYVDELDEANEGLK
jgi:hypothetical protein